MRVSDRLRIGIVGGSIAGCAAAAEFSRLGHDVTVFERSVTKLVSRGAGIATTPAVLAALVSRGAIDADVPQVVPAVGTRYVCRGGASREGRWLGSLDLFRVSTLNWAHLFDQLRRRVPEHAYRNGVRIERLDTTGSAAIVHRSDGGQERFDLVVCADGYHSVGRSFLDPDAELEYPGVVLWRGLVPEIKEDTFGVSAGMTGIMYPGGHGVVYVIPGPDGETVPGDRLVNFGYYLHFPEEDLDAVLVDDEGRQQSGSVAFGAVPHNVREKIRDRFTDLLPPYFEELFDRTADTAIQAIYSVEVPSYVRDRVCLVGDAGSVLPPWTGRGVFKAVANVTSLVDAIGDGSALDERLQAWNAEQVKTVATLSPEAEQTERGLVSEVPDFTSMSMQQTKEWLTGLHPGRELTLPEG
jgi:2-polyprenyl-6-methoxyphenol hydroxylase-like FAD-dependent oxidoreductase